MQQFFSYWFWPNPANWQYGDRTVLLVLALSFGLIIFSFVIKFWRSRQSNPMTRTLSVGWSIASFWFGMVSLVLTVSRVEMIQFVAMRFLWVLWLLCVLAYVFFQILQFRRRHYVVMKRANVTDERDKYLPRKKR